jgi:hypothetical protein
MIRNLLLVVTALCVVVGCAKPLTANDMPRPKAGLWTWVSEGKRGANAGRTCLSGKPAHILGPGCPQMTYARVSDGVVEIDNKCPLGAGGASDFKARFSGDFRTSYVMDVTGVVSTPDAKPPSVDNARFTYTFAGACPAGLTPDDD